MAERIACDVFSKPKNNYTQGQQVAHARIHHAHTLRKLRAISASFVCLDLCMTSVHHSMESPVSFVHNRLCAQLWPWKSRAQQMWPRAIGTSTIPLDLCTTLCTTRCHSLLSLVHNSNSILCRAQHSTLSVPSPKACALPLPMQLEHIT